MFVISVILNLDANLFYIFIICLFIYLYNIYLCIYSFIYLFIYSLFRYIIIIFLRCFLSFDFSLIWSFSFILCRYVYV